MITISREQCNGCGQCVEVCPTGAVYLVGGEPVVEQKLCCDCEACIAACPAGAITLTSLKESVTQPVHVPAPLPEAQEIQVKTKSAPSPFRASVLPAVGGALAWGWREIVPRLAEYLYDLDGGRAARQRPAARRSTRSNGSSASSRGGGSRRRRRQRGG